MKPTPPFLGVQYYRPPFPRERHWRDDLRRVRDSGLDVVQFWMVWGWCEPSPGKFRFDDYERLADEAGKAGLKVVLSTLIELQPFWIHRAHPDAAMVDIEGHAVASCARCECLSGLTPGCCSDHPAIRRRMIAFLKAAAWRFGPRKEVLAWNSWNENRWRNHAPDYVCFCKHSTSSLHAFLRQRHGDLAGVGRAWGRRYTDWSDVRIGRLRWSGCYPEWRDFTDWLIWRASDMARWRFEALASVPPRKFINNHTGNPSVFGGVNLNENAFSRGLDWENARADGYGFSAYPLQIGATYSENVSTAEQHKGAVSYCVRLASCLQVGKPVWLNELEGGPLNLHGRYSRRLAAAEQQTWIWAAISRGIRGVMLWPWRSEQFGGESNLGAITSEDGEDGNRIAALRRASAMIREHRATLEAYRPDLPQVGVVWNRDSYTLNWISHASLEGKPFPYRAPGVWLAYPNALEELGIPYSIYDEHHLPATNEPRLMIVPRPVGLRDAAARWLVEFARRGGTVFTEAGVGAHDEHTFFRHVGEKPFFKTIGIREVLYRGLSQPRRVIPKGALGNRQPIRLALGELESSFALDGGRGRIHALGPDRFPMLADVQVGKGRVIVLGTMLGHTTNLEGLRAMLKALCPAPAIQVCGSRGGFVTWRSGWAGANRLLFLLNMGVAQTVIVTGPRRATDWFGHRVVIRASKLTLHMAAHDHAVLEWKA